MDGQLLVTTPVEAATAAVLAGAVPGSFVRMAAAGLTFARLARANSRPNLGKVEVLAVRRRVAPGCLELLLTADDDRGGSTALAAELHP